VTSARLRLDVNVPNAYALSMAVLPRSAAGGGFEVGVAQNAGAGYRVNYTPAAGNAPATLSLLRVNPQGSAIVDSVNAPANFDNRQRHTVDFTRDAAGEMAVLIDGVETMRVRDVGIRDGFNRVLFVNRGGDYRIQSFSGYATP
jgi:hypothetical protein